MIQLKCFYLGAESILLVHSPNVCSGQSQSWKPKDKDSTQLSHMSDRDPATEAITNAPEGLLH